MLSALKLVRMVRGYQSFVRYPKWLCYNLNSSYDLKPFLFTTKSWKHTQTLISLSGQRLHRKPNRKKLTSNIADEYGKYTVTAYATADEYNLEGLISFLEQQGLYNRTKLPSDLNDAAYFTAKYTIDLEPRDILIFRQGTVVFWNVPAEEQFNLLKILRDFEEDPYSRSLVQNESESLEYMYSSVEDTDTNTETKIKNDVVVFSSLESLELEKYSYSNGLMLSVKLAIWENYLSEYINSIEGVTEVLKEGGNLNMSRKEVLQKTGELYTLSHLINLSSPLKDTPDFYWDRDNLERLYTQSLTYFSIDSRTRVMNNKLSHCIDLVDLLRDHLNTKHEVRLEWMIIILILVEVLFEILHIIERQSDTSSTIPTLEPTSHN